jgi:hypothetical protein
LVVGILTSIFFHLALGLGWQGLAACFGAGFGFMLVILTLTQGRVKPADRNSELYPPVWVRRPVIAALFVGTGMFWVNDQQLTTSARSGNRVVFQGPVAVAMGIAMIAAPVPPNIWLIRQQPRQRAAVVGSIAALLVVAIGLAFACMRIAQLYG